MKFFIDTGFLIALANKDDKFHQVTVDRYSEILDVNNFKFLTSNHVVSEFLTFIERKVSYLEAINWGKEIFEEKLFEIILSSESSLNSAFYLYKGQGNERKILSFVDCIILETIRTYEVQELLSYDEKLIDLFNQLKS